MRFSKVQVPLLPRYVYRAVLASSGPSKDRRCWNPRTPQCLRSRRAERTRAREQVPTNAHRNPPRAHKAGQAPVLRRCSRLLETQTRPRRHSRHLPAPDSRAASRAGRELAARIQRRFWGAFCPVSRGGLDPHADHGVARREAPQAVGQTLVDHSMQKQPRLPHGRELAQSIESNCSRSGSRERRQSPWVSQ